MEELKPCPFCGGAFKMGQEPHDSPYVGGFFYLYHDYGPLGSAARKCPISVDGHYETAELAISAWNTRADLCADPALLAEAVEVLRGAINGLDWAKIHTAEAGFESVAVNSAHAQVAAFLSKLENRHDR